MQRVLEAPPEAFRRSVAELMCFFAASAVRRIGPSLNKVEYPQMWLCLDLHPVADLPRDVAGMAFDAPSPLDSIAAATARYVRSVGVVRWGR